MNLPLDVHILAIFLLTLLNLCSASPLVYTGSETPSPQTVIECLSSLLGTTSFCAHYLLPDSNLGIQLSLCSSDPIAVRSICTSLLAKAKISTNTNTNTNTNTDTDTKTNTTTTTVISSDESGSVTIFSSSSHSGDYEADEIPKNVPHEYISNHYPSYGLHGRRQLNKRSIVPAPNHDPPTAMKNQNSNGKTKYKTVNISPTSNSSPNPNSGPGTKPFSPPKVNPFIKPPGSAPHHVSPPSSKNAKLKSTSSTQTQAQKANLQPIKPPYRHSRIKLTGHPAGGEHMSSSSRGLRKSYESQSTNEVQTANQETDSDVATEGAWEKGIRQRRGKRKLHLQNRQPRIYETIAASVERERRKKEDRERRVSESLLGDGVGGLRKDDSMEENGGVVEKEGNLESGMIGGKRMDGRRIQLY
jgi:hypothetical protein